MQSSGWGLGVDYTHSKAYAALNFATDPVYRHLEFTDGNNLLTFNVMYRFEPVLAFRGWPDRHETVAKWVLSPMHARRGVTYAVRNRTLSHN